MLEGDFSRPSLAPIRFPGACPPSFAQYYLSFYLGSHLGFPYVLGAALPSRLDFPVVDTFA